MQLAGPRGGRVGVEHIVFQLRHDRQRLHRLKEFLSWKELRKRLRTATEKAPDDPLTADDSKEAGREPRRKRVRLPWDYLSTLKPPEDQVGQLRPAGAYYYCRPAMERTRPRRGSRRSTSASGCGWRTT
jgi:hypothetical protein